MLLSLQTLLVSVSERMLSYSERFESASWGAAAAAITVLCALQLTA